MNDAGTLLQRDNDDSVTEIPHSELSDSDKRVLARQTQFLDGYATGGTIKAGIRHAGISYDAVELWRKSDKLGFRARFAIAHDTFCDTLEDIALALVQQLKPGQTPLLLITMLNANRPDKYRPNAIVTDNTAAELLAEVRKLSRSGRNPVPNTGEAIVALRGVKKA